MTQFCVFLAITIACPFPISEFLVSVCNLVCNLCKFANFTGAGSRFCSYVKVSVLFHHFCQAVKLAKLYAISELMLGYMVGYSVHIPFIAEFLGTLLFFFLVAAMYEGLKYFRERLHNFAMKKRKERKNKLETKNEVNSDLRYVLQMWCVCLCVLLWVWV